MWTRYRYLNRLPKSENFWFAFILLSQFEKTWKIHTITLSISNSCLDLAQLLESLSVIGRILLNFSETVKGCIEQRENQPKMSSKEQELGVGVKYARVCN